jgi:hypothetical protein
VPNSATASLRTTLHQDTWVNHDALLSSDELKALDAEELAAFLRSGNNFSYRAVRANVWPTFVSPFLMVDFTAVAYHKLSRRAGSPM